MNQPGLFRHGGRMGEAAALFPEAPLPWIDLSTGINPHAWAGPRAEFAALRRLPDPAETAALEAAAASAFGVADPAMVAAVPGAEFGLRLLPRATNAASVTIAAPTYGGHAEAWTAAGRDVRLVPWGQNLPDTEALVIVNPNNPDGRALPAAEISGLATERRVLIVDEFFCEVTPEISVAARASDRLIVLRSFGKFFGLAGVRLGFVIAGPAIIAQVRASFGDWPVSAEALAAGNAAYTDAAWAQATRARLRQDTERLDAMLQKAGLNILGGTSLFRLCASPDAAKWFEHLARHGMLVRPFTHEPSWLRFGLPGNDAEWSRLQSALQQGLS